MAQAAPAVPVSPASPTSDKPENVETRISNLKASLKIAPDQEKKWNAVATVMRENAGKMEKLMTEKRGQAPGEMTAVDDLVTYQKFSQAHVDGLKKLTASFKVLYDAMPTPQKKNADMVFQSFGREPGKPAATKS